VILALLLGIALLSAISNKGVATPVFEEKPKKETISSVDDKNNRCGLSISAPLSMQKTYGSIRLTGLTSGCNWPIDGTTVLFAQVINGAGVPVSDFISVQKNDSDIINNAFDTTISINGNPSGTGYLILIPTKQQETKSITVRIPLQFVRN
jgi:hypothetical protein